MRPGDSMLVMQSCTAALLGAAFLPPVPRTLAFVGLGATLFFSYFYIVNLNLCAQVALYLLGAAFFVRCVERDAQRGGGYWAWMRRDWQARLCLG